MDGSFVNCTNFPAKKKNRFSNKDWRSDFYNALSPKEAQGWKERAGNVWLYERPAGKTLHLVWRKDALTSGCWESCVAHDVPGRAKSYKQPGASKPSIFPGVDAWALFIPASRSLCAGAGMHLNHPQRASSALWSPGKQPRAGGAMDQGFFRAPCSALPCSNWMLLWLGA